MSESGAYEEYGFVAELYDHVVPYRDRADIDFYVEAAQAVGGRVLEVGCGTGRVLLPTARAGVEIVGIDRSPHMLAVCRQRLGAEPTEVQDRVELIEADMRHFDLGREFDLITIPFRPFQHLTTAEDQFACLQSIHRHLAPEGRFILDVFNPSLEALTRDNLGDEFGEEPEFVLEDGRRVVRVQKTNSRDYHDQIVDVELIYYVTHPDGSKERLVHSFPMRYLFRFEAEYLLRLSGFEVEHLYAGYDKSHHDSNYPGELIFVAKKFVG